MRWTRTAAIPTAEGRKKVFSTIFLSSHQNFEIEPPFPHFLWYLQDYRCNLTYAKRGS